MTKDGDMDPTARQQLMIPPEAEDAPFENESMIGGRPPSPDEAARGTVVGGPVLAHVQRFSDAVCGATGACTISTYDGHDPDRTRALDILVSSAYGVMPSSAELGNSVADFALAHWSDYCLWYVIWRQRINSNDGRGWRPMEDRGSITQNHFDHCHASFLSDCNGGGDDGLPLKRGSRGARVSRLQRRLSELGWRLIVDGDFGSMSEVAVVEFQTQHQLEQDGIVGRLTSEALGFGWPW